MFNHVATRIETVRPERVEFNLMSSETQELIRICEQLPAAQRAEVTDFARFLLARSKNGDAAPRREVVERWLAGARGAAKPGVTTEQVMTLTRGEP
jgi:hypothetical protein